MQNLSTTQPDSQKARFFAKRSLGQNFLIAPKVAEHIARLATNTGAERTRPDSGLLTPASSSTVLEVGPGKGMLTRELLKRASKVIAIEKDDRLFAALQQDFVKKIGDGKLHLIHGDAVDVLENGKLKIENGDTDDRPDQFSIFNFQFSSPYTIAANIPYNLTGELLRLFLALDPKPASVTVLVQKEVAERIAANPPAGGGKESILSLSIKAFGEPRIEGKVPRTLFRPVPSVDSAILHIANVSNAFFDDLTLALSFTKERGSTAEECFFSLVKLGFKQKRKFLLSNLAQQYPKDEVRAAFLALELDEKARAEALTLTNWADLLKILSSKL